MCKFHWLILVLLWEITQAYTISPTACKETVPSIRASGAVLPNSSLQAHYTSIKGGRNYIKMLLSGFTEY